MSHYYYNEADLAIMDMFPASSSSSAPSSTIYAPPCHMAPSHRSAYDPRTTSSVPAYLPQPSAMPQPSYSHQSYWSHHQHSLPHQHPLPQATMGLPSMAPYPSSTTTTTAVAYAHSQPFAPETTLPSSYSLHHRSERSPSTVSTGAFSPQPSVDGSIAGADYSRSISPSCSNSPDLRAYGYLNKNGTWTCAYPGCTSKAVFTRGCDLRKHHKRHTKSFFCRQEGCPQATGGGFSSKKDLARHEAKHNPGVVCEWDGCERIFSRVDNMRDHVKRIHLKGARPQPAKRGSSSLT